MVEVKEGDILIFRNDSYIHARKELKEDPKDYMSYFVQQFSNEKVSRMILANVFGLREKAFEDKDPPTTEIYLPKLSEFPTSHRTKPLSQ